MDKQKRIVKQGQINSKLTPKKSTETNEDSIQVTVQGQINSKSTPKDTTATNVDSLQVTVRRKIDRNGKSSYEEFTAFLSPKHLNQKFTEFSIYDIFEDKNHTLWFGISSKLLSGGILSYQQNNTQSTWKLYGKNDSLKITYRPRIAQTPDGAIWVVTWDDKGGGINRLDPTTKTWQALYINNLFLHPDPKMTVGKDERDIHTSARVTQNGHLWIGGKNRLFCYKGGDWTQNNNWKIYTHSLPNDRAFPNQKRFLDILETSDNALWFIIEGNPPIRANTFLIYHNIHFLKTVQDSIHWFISDKDQLICNISARWYLYGVDKGLMDNPTGIYVTHQDQVWAVGGHKNEAAAAQFHPDQNTWSLHVISDFSRIIYAKGISETPDGKIWVGAGNPGNVSKAENAEHISEGGLRYFDGKSWQFGPTAVPRIIRHVVSTSDGKLWVGGGSLRYRKPFETNFSIPKFPGIDFSNWVDILQNIDSPHNTQKRTIMVHFRQQGTYEYDGKAWLPHIDLRNAQEFTSAQIENKVIRFATNNNGIFFFDGQHWVKHIPLTHLRFNSAPLLAQSIRISEQGNHNDIIWVNNTHKSDNGNQFQTIRYPIDITPPKSKMDPIISQKLKEQSLPYLGYATFKWTGHDHWNAMPESTLQFSYRFDDEPWSPYSFETSVFKDSLYSGMHTLRIRARDQNLNEEPYPVVLSFTVRPPIWQQSWFLGTISLLIGTIVYLSIRVVKRGKALSQSNKALSDANQSLTQEMVERERLDTQIQDLQYLYTLRATLAETHTTEETLQAVGQAATELLGSSGGIAIALDDQSYTFGQPTGTSQQYERKLHWGERHRGEFILYSPFTLSESQERTLLDETVGQLTRVLESQELQMQLLQSSRLISLGQMAAGVAHELNQPLGGISATAEDYYLRLQDNMPVSNDQLKDLFKRVLGMVDRMSNTVEHLRIFSRDTSQEPGKPLYINDVIYSSLDIIGTQLKNHGIELTLNLKEDLPQISGHPYQIEQIFLNLLGNARDALDARQESNEIFKTITLSTQKNANTIIATVQDNGQGIAPEDLNRIFEPFYTTKPADKGTGLGLSITYAIVKNHGGNITCTSTINRGTTFEVTFPILQSNT